MIGFLCLNLCVGINASLFFISAQSFVPNNTVNKRKQRIVLADTYVCAGVNLRTSLTNENVAGKNCLTVATLRAKTFCLTVSTVVGGTGTFLMSE